MLSLKLSLVLVLAVVSANARNVQHNNWSNTYRNGYPQKNLVRTLSGVVSGSFVRQSGGAPAVLPQPVNDASQLANTCPVGFVQPIWTGAEITETFCRCPDGGYGLTCQENFANPCSNGVQYSPADASIPANFFIECNWNYPYLMKCAPGTVWDQSLLTCNYAAAPVQQASAPGYGYGQQAAAPAYGQQVVQQAAPAYSAPVVQQQAAPAYSAPVVQQQAAPAYSAPVVQQQAAPAYSAPVVQQQAAPAYSAPVVQQQAAPAYSAPVVQQQAAPAYSAPVQQFAPAAPAYSAPVVQQQAAPAYSAPVQQFAPAAPAYAPQQQSFTPTFQQSGY